MSEQTKTLVPKLRFPEFQGAGEWEEVKLGQLGKLESGLTYSPDDIRENGLLVLRSSNVQNGEIRLNDNVYVTPSVRGANLSKPNDILICVRNGSKGLIGKNAILPEGMPLCTHGAFMTIFRSPSAKFVFQLFQTSAYQKQVDGDLGATINSINGSQFIKYKFHVPKPLEQQKIADCLSSIDVLITAQTNKIAALKDHKKGLMQQLFPAEGETVPQLRFAEFQDAGEWEMKEVGKVFEVTRGYVLSMGLVKATESEETPFPVYSSQTKNNGLAGFYNDYLYESAITWTTDGANAGDVNYRHGKFYCTNVCGVLINNDGFANLCTAALLNSVSKKYVSYVGNPKLMNGVMSKIEIPFPSVPEQQKISDCLSSIDELITAQIQKLEALKTHKNGLMQQLFPNADEVNE